MTRERCPYRSMCGHSKWEQDYDSLRSDKTLKSQQTEIITGNMWNGRGLMLSKSRALHMNDDTDRYNESGMVPSVQSLEKNS